MIADELSPDLPGTSLRPNTFAFREEQVVSSLHIFCTKWAQCRRGFIVARFQRIDMPVNNAGIFIAKPFTQYAEADYAALLCVNIAGFLHITLRPIAEMEKNGGGHIVQISTSLIDHAIAGVPSALASLTKGGLNGATRSCAIEYVRRGIRVDALALGIVKTPMHSTETQAQLAGLHPVGRMGDIPDAVGPILYLESAGFVTSEILHVDGGQSAGHGRRRRDGDCRHNPRVSRCLNVNLVNLRKASWTKTKARVSNADRPGAAKQPARTGSAHERVACDPQDLHRSPAIG